MVAGRTGRQARIPGAWQPRTPAVSGVRPSPRRARHLELRPAPRGLLKIQPVAIDARSCRQVVEYSVLDLLRVVASHEHVETLAVLERDQVACDGARVVRQVEHLG